MTTTRPRTTRAETTRAAGASGAGTTRAGTTRTAAAPRILLGLAGLGAAVLMLWITAKGPAANPDSTVYLETAANVRAGLGFYEQGRALTHYPPGYPLLVAAASLATPMTAATVPPSDSTASAGTSDRTSTNRPATTAPTALSMVPAARAVQAALFGLNAVLFALAISAATSSSASSTSSAPASAASRPASLVVAAAAFVFFVSSRPVVWIHSHVWSEALFLSCAFGGLLLLHAHVTLDRRHPWRLLAAAVLFLGACAARYVGVALLPLLVAPLWLGADRPRRDRLREVGLALVVVGTPMIAWLMRNVSAGGSATNRPVMLHPMGWTELRTLVVSLHDSVLDLRVPTALKLTTLAMATLLLASAVWKLRQMRREATASSSSLPPAPIAPFAPIAPIARLSLAAAAGYFLVLILSISLVDPTIFFDVRVVLPGVLLAAPGLVAIAHAALAAFNSRVPTRTAAAAFVVVCAVNAASALPWMRDANIRGQGYTSTAWRESPTIAVVKTLATRMTIYSNDPWALRLLANLDAQLIPLSYVPLTNLPNADYDAELRAMCQACLDRRAVLAWFPLTGPYPSVREQIESTCALSRRDFSDGFIYWQP